MFVYDNKTYLSTKKLKIKLRDSCQPSGYQDVRI